MMAVVRFREGLPRAAGASEVHPVAALELEDLARLVGRGDLEAEALDDLARRRDLLGVRFGELARRRSTASPPARRGRCRPSRPPCAAIGIWLRPAPSTDQWYSSPNSRSAVRFMCSDVLGMRADAAEDAEHGLDEERRLDQAAVDEMGAACRDGRCRSTRTRSGCRSRRRWSGCTRCPRRCS